MPDASDMELLRDYGRHGSEAAFAELVRRHVNLVYSAALRHVHIAAHAEEITQAVFVILARKGAGLRADTVLEGWLYETTRLTALSFLRGERRRQFREQEAYMQSTLPDSTTDTAWNQLAPLLDEGISQLSKKDRDALMLRFFKERSVREVAASLNLSEAAAQRRVLRAVEKLRRFFTKRGVALPAGVLTAAISAHSVQAAPALLAKTATAIAITNGAATSGSTLTLIKGALKLMAWTKAKTAIIAGVGVLLATGTMVSVYEYNYGKTFWEHRFDAAYKLKPGEVSRFIPRPFISARSDYYRKRLPTVAIQFGQPPPDVFIFKQDDQGKFDMRASMVGDKQNPLWRALNETMGLRRYEFDDPANLLKLDVAGDWTVREGTSRETFMAALEPILFKTKKRRIHFEKRSEEREVLVISGNAKSEKGKTVQVYAEKIGDGARNTGFGVEGLAGMLGEELKTYVVNEAETSGQLPWEECPDVDSDSMGNRRAELTDKVLKNLTAHTGLVFTYQNRSVDVWQVSEVK